MSAPTPTQVKERLMALAVQVSGIVTVADDWPEDNEPFTAAELPALIVVVRGAVNTRINLHKYQSTRTFELHLPVARIADDVKNPDTAALEAVEPFLLSIPAFFAARPRLENGDSGLSYASSIPQDLPARKIVREGAEYTGVIFTMTVDTLHTG